MPDPNDPLIQQLARFTPGSGIDRDALMFEAGRRSVRRPLIWPVLVAILVVAEVTTLVLLWPTPTQPTGGLVPAPASDPPIAQPPPLPEPSPLTEGIWSVRTSFDQVWSTPVSTGIVDPVTPRPLRPVGQLD